MTSQPNHPSPVSRRNFLKAAGSFAGAFVAAPVAAVGAPAAADTFATAASSGSLVAQGASQAYRPVRIGLLLTQSQLQPELAQSMLSGMRLALAQASDQAGGRPVEIRTAQVSVSPYRAAEQARQFVMAEQVDLLVGFVGGQTAALLRPLLHERQIPLIVNTVGANVPRPASASPYIVRNSLQQWQASWALGAWAAASIGPRAVVASSFYESGYDTLHVFGQGFQSAGGTVLSTHVTHRPDQTGDLSAVMAAIAAARPDVVYAAYGGKLALSFVQAYAQAGLSSAIPLVASPFMVDEGLLAQHGRAGLHIRSGLSWSPLLQTAENRAFLVAYQARTGQTADAFAVLGHDAGRLIVQALNAVAGEIRTGRLAQALGAASFVGPRGQVTAQPEAQALHTSLYLREVRRAGGMIGNTIVAPLAAPPVLEIEATTARSGIKSGWANPYLCF